MALVTNGNDIQNAIYGVLKQDGYLVFLGSGGQEIARVKDEAGGEDLPYALSAQGLELSLKNASGTTISSAKLETPLRHVQQICCKPSAGEWTLVSDFSKKIVDGGLLILRKGTQGITNAFSFEIAPAVQSKWQFPKGNNYFYDIKVTLMTAENKTGGDGVGNNATTRFAPQTTIYQFSVHRDATLSNKTFNIRLTDIPEAYINAWGVVFLVEIEGSPLEAV